MGKSKNNEETTEERNERFVCVIIKHVIQKKGEWHTRKNYNRYNRQKVLFWIYEGLINIRDTNILCWKVTSVVSNPVRRHRRQPTRLPHSWDSPGKNTGVGCHFLLLYMKVKSESEVAQSCLTLRDPMDCSLPGSSVHGIFQAGILEWGAIAFSNILS